jgi:ubiquinone/menaquinone biosynthesis C-methylase UbiE
MTTDAVALRPVAATLLALAGIREGQIVLDVGCGTGLLTYPAAAAAGPAGRVYGVDPDAAALAIARERRPSDVLWVRGDAARLPFATGSFDKLVSTAFLYDSGATEVLAECARVLAPGGRVALCARDGLAGPLRDVGLRIVHEAHDDAERIHYVTATPLP